MSKIITKWITDDAVTKEKVNADVAGDGLIQAGDGSLEVNDDNSTLEIATDVLRVKDLGITTGKLAGTSVTAAKLGSDVAGNGLTGGNGSAIAALDDSTGGANLASAVNVSANGLAVKIDDDTIDQDGSSRLRVKPNGIGAAEIDETDNYTWTGTHDFQSGTVHVATPSSDTHAVTKAYADALRQGVLFKDQCKALADSAQDPGTGGLPSNIDGVTSWSAGDRVLLTNESSGIDNGIWEVQTGTWTRPTDFDTGDNASGAQTWIDQGASYGETQWACTTNEPNDVIDTDSLAFVQTSGAGQITAGTGLVKSGNTVHIGTSGTTGDINGINRTADNIAAAVDNTSIALAANQIEVKDLGVSTGKLAATSVTAAKLGSDVAGNGLTGGNGSAIAALSDPTGGANLAKSINVSANGLAVKIDDVSIGEDGTDRLYVKANGITETELNSSVAGDGISGGGGSALDLDINGIASAETSADDNDLIAIYDDTATALRKMTRGNFLAGVSGENIKTEMHKITSGETTNGYFTTASTPVNAQSVRASVQGGPNQVNKQIVGATGATPDFDVLSTNQIHFNNNGAATGLSEDLTTDDIMILEYHT